MTNLYIGLISGTSIDAIDAALIEADDAGLRLRNHHSHSIPQALREEIVTLSHTGADEIERMGVLDRQLGKLFAEAALALLHRAKCSAKAVTAIGSHGQTIRHRPPSDDKLRASFTLQIADPNTIAELTGITTVADFRRRDIAAGGEGAPLTPAFHDAVFRDDSCSRAIVNIGGIANVTLLNDEPVVGFDTGPGNTLMDAWTAKHKGCAYDQDGEWAASGRIDGNLLDQLLHHEYLSKPVPKSTGKEAFNLSALLPLVQVNLKPADVQATLTEFTAVSIAEAIPNTIEEIYLCGGGAANPYLVYRLEAKLEGRKIGTTEDLGIHPDWVEAAAFAWLALQTLSDFAGNLPSVTGANGPRVLGGVYPGGN